MQKKLLEHSLNDAFMLRQFKFPTTDNVLSKVFDLYSKQKTLNKTAEYEFVEPSNEKVHYKLYLEGSSSSNYIVIEEWLQSQLIKKHMYK
jgi:NADH dehydrogenase/NADH:ubiquinone oxidoreductase subunit G